MLSLTSLPCHCLALTPRRGPSRVLTRLPPPEPRGPRRKPPARPSRKTSANEAPAPRAPRCRARGSWAPGPGPAHGGGAVCTPGPPGTGCSGVGALHAELPIPPGLTRRLLWVSGRGTRLALGEMREAARGPWRVCVCACVHMRAHACAGQVGGFGVKAAGPPRLTVPRSHLALQDVAPRAAPGDCARGRRGWRRGGQGPGGRPPARPCPAVTSCGTEPRAAKPGAGACSPAGPSDRGGGGPRSGGASREGAAGGRGGLGGAGRVAKSSDRDRDRDGRAEGAAR